MSEETPDYLTLSYVKSYLKIDRDDDRSDTEIIRLSSLANLEADKVIYPFEPIAPKRGTKLFRQAKALALAYFDYLWDLRNSQTHLTPLELETFRDQKETLIQVLKAKRNERTRSAIISDDPRADTLRLPSQRDTFIDD